MVRLDQLQIEVDSLLCINKNLSTLNVDYFNLVRIEEKKNENLLNRIQFYEEISLRENERYENMVKENKKKRIKQGVVVFAGGLILGILTTFF